MTDDVHTEDPPELLPDGQETPEADPPEPELEEPQTDEPEPAPGGEA
jgi:hypothetical protein